tara:strand:- start:209 stop:535 length:327 start_codon:yes stop_codon:yes gene_type:complete
MIEDRIGLGRSAYDDAYQKSNQALFSYLDTLHINCSDLEDEQYTYKAQDVLVQDTFEVPIVLHYPKCHVRFEFNTEAGDSILFSIVVAHYEDRVEGIGTGSTCMIFRL